MERYQLVKQANNESNRVCSIVSPLIRGLVFLFLLVVDS